MAYQIIFKKEYDSDLCDYRYTYAGSEFHSNKDLNEEFFDLVLHGEVTL